MKLFSSLPSTGFLFKHHPTIGWSVLIPEHLDLYLDSNGETILAVEDDPGITYWLPVRSATCREGLTALLKQAPILTGLEDAIITALEARAKKLNKPIPSGWPMAL